MIFHGVGTEVWSERGQGIEPTLCDGIQVGVMICADAWEEHNSSSLIRKGADILMDLAAWPYGFCCGDPTAIWQQYSERTGLPMIICNQTEDNQYTNICEARYFGKRDSTGYILW